MPYKLFTVSLEVDQIEALKRLARGSEMSASALARYAIARFLHEPAIFLPSAHSDTIYSNDSNYEKEALR